ncbi:MAG: FAD-dependent oxidoreductase [Steroidobacter sp.]
MTTASSPSTWPVPISSIHENAPIVVIGSGPVGVRTVQELLRRSPNVPVVLYGAEPVEPYNRARLTSFLAGDITWESLRSELPASSSLQRRYGCAVVAVDLGQRTVLDASGCVQPYSKLVFAMGSKAHVPTIDGISLPGVHAFRDLADTRQLFVRSFQSRCTVVLGGGLLGIEAARAMRRFDTRMIVVETGTRLMSRQLDEQASMRLEQHLQSIGIFVELGQEVRRIVGETHVEGVELGDGRQIECDTVVIATGIRPTVDLARAAGLAIDRGIRVDDWMRTSDEHVYAVGECAEHRGNIYGLVAPGFEQAEVAAGNICEHWTRYPGSIAATRLKVVGLPVFSIGVATLENMPTGARLRIHESSQRYTRLVTQHGRLIGALQIGDENQIGRLQEAVAQQRAIQPWQWLRFGRTGKLWSDQTPQHVAAWPANVTVCNCTGVTRGQLTSAIESGCDSMTSLVEKTGASTVCGSCKPLLAQMIGSNVAVAPVEAARTLQFWGATALLLALIFMLPWQIPYATTVRTEVHWDFLWREGFYKQLSGYSVLGMTALALSMSLRKRVSKLTAFKFSTWRSLHVVVGALVLIALVVHTGGRAGSNLNLLLLGTFTALIVIGSGAALVIAAEHKLGARAPLVRARWYWLHLLLFWPVPVLLGMHVLKTYYF